MIAFIQQLINGIALGTTYALIALSFVLIFGVMRVLNAALGAMVVVGMYSAWYFSEHVSRNAILCILAAIVVTVVIGLLIDVIAIAPIRKSLLGPFLSTLGCGILLEGILRTWFTSQPQPFRVQMPTGSLKVGSLVLGKGQLTIIAIALVMILATDYIVTRTAAGRKLRAVSEDPGMAMSLGIDSRKVRVLAVVAASAVAGTTGVLLGTNYAFVSPTLGIGLMLKGLAVLIVGGLTSFRGAAIVGLLLGVTEVMANAYISSVPRDAVSFGLLIVVLLVRPEGLFGNRRAAASIRPRTA